MIEAIGLSRSFGAVMAVKNVNLKITAGEIYGLVGSDGAGKTTTLRLLVGALRPDTGQAMICGYSIAKQGEQARSQVGYLSQRFSLYEDLTVLENIHFFAEVRGLKASDWLPRSMEILEFVGLAQFKDRLAGMLSGGMKQKLGLASALVSRPHVLLLDEPTTGVDPVTRQDFWQLLVKLVSRTSSDADQVAVLITTPYMDEASRCNRIGFMKQGSIIAEGTPTQLRGRLNDQIIELRGRPLREIMTLASNDPDVLDVRIFGDRLHLRNRLGRSAETIKRLGQNIQNSGFQLDSIRSTSPNLEDVFIVLSETQALKETPATLLSEPHAEALRILLDRIPPNRFRWALTGSANLRLQGVDVEVHDLDIQCHPNDIRKIEKALSDYRSTPVHVWETGNVRSLDGKCEIEGVEIELIAAIELQDQKGKWKKVQRSEQTIWIEWGDLQVPLISLRDEAKFYSDRGKMEKVLVIEERIKKLRGNNHV